MLNKKMISLSLFSLVVCSLAVATEYKTPKVEYKKHSPSQAEMKAADSGENLRVEGASSNDRQIASEVESDREPSSLKTASQKKEVVIEEKKEHPESDMTPKPWMYRMQSQSEK